MTDSTESPTLAHRPPERSWMRRIVMPLIILAVAGVLLYVGRQHEADQTAQVQDAVAALCREIDRNRHHDVMTLSHVQQMGLTESVTLRLVEALDPGLPEFSVIVEVGDTTPGYGGDGSATHRAYVSTSGDVQIALRLHHPGDPHRITVLGYWMP